ncbi:MAG: DUF4861 family protein [Rikenellaceae bacterium]
MKKILFSLLLLGVMGAVSAQELLVEVHNKLNFARETESVEVDWDDIEKRLKGVTAESVVVLDCTGRQIPSQVLYDGEDEPEELLFQATVDAKDTSRYRVKIGVREAFKKQAYGRFVPERMDDFAWENNRVAYRVYGKALEVELFSPGIDVWMKRTPELIIDKWYKGGHYHTDHGEGLDMYDVGRSLGSGSITPMEDGDLVYPSHNFTKYKVLDDGDLRIKFEVEFPKFKVGGVEVEQRRTITLDANTNMNIVEVEYDGDFYKMDAAVGIKIRNKDGEVVNMGANYLAYQEPVKGRNGITYVLAVTPNSGTNQRLTDHIIKSTTLKPDKEYRYLCGGFWSKSGVIDAAEWSKIIETERAKFLSPLVVKYK